MKKIHLIIVLAAGLFSFAATFTAGSFLKKNRASQETASQVPAPSSQAAAPVQANSLFESLVLASEAAEDTALGLGERQLQHLIVDIRSKLNEHQDREKELEKEAERIEISRQSMQSDIDRLNDLQRKLNLTLAEIEQKQTELQSALTEIEGLEKDNYKRLASTYEKMDASQAGRIMTSMATSNQMQDSVKILYYMNERTAGKLLAEIATQQPELASLICTRLKHVKEIN